MVIRQFQVEKGLNVGSGAGLKTLNAVLEEPVTVPDFSKMRPFQPLHYSHEKVCATPSTQDWIFFMQPSGSGAVE
ncbi:hypothetical protein [Brevibacterium renqingii]|uniref:hypothetical protein n=1 Tax=Brevibacterium renqingii TaxID=2776916 RepID=UPI001AE03F5D|nr:hypothetical protein [Brevibacterium renqingii]